MTASPARSLWRDRAGAAAIEAAFTLPLVLAFLLGVAEVGRMAWTKTALTFAVQEAARCASVRKTDCGDAAQVQAFAAEKVHALKIPASAFTYTQAACGRRVVGQVNEGFILYKLAPTAPAISASACRA